MRVLQAAFLADLLAVIEFGNGMLLQFWACAQMCAIGSLPPMN